MKTALFTFIVGRSSFIELKNAGRRSQCGRKPYSIA